MEFFEQIMKWPVIVQGALGSALFWLLLLIGQKATLYIFNIAGKDRSIATYFSLMAFAAPTEELRARGHLTCLYAGFHYFLKGLIVIIIAFLISQINPVISIVGYMISLYFLFRALSYVQHFSSFGSKEDALNQLIKTGNQLCEEPANKQINKDT
tara:strand:- start:430 stop:894 length:465 start_codon:yes stop_codon:yes gene_type:complete